MLSMLGSDCVRKVKSENLHQLNASMSLEKSDLECCCSEYIEIPLSWLTWLITPLFADYNHICQEVSYAISIDGKLLSFWNEK